METNLLKGKNGIIFGALDESSIAWKIALACHRAGARFTLSNAPIALRMGGIQDLAKICETEVISADATSSSDLEDLAKRSVSFLGAKIDFVLHSIGMSPNVRKKKDYRTLNTDWYLKTLDISALSFYKIIQTLDRLDLLNEWASILGISYVAAQRTFPLYADMAEAKAVLESIARSYGYHLGKAKKIRVNTLSQSPTPTRAGTGIPGFQPLFEYTEKIAPLGNATAEECALYCVFLFSDMSRKVTMQNLYHDGGFSSTGLSLDVLDKS
ncbi:MAG: SDR family oxidoreductase [Cytophagales bacterium]|nr:SDR family oxidoreductase [Cytophagales bacterium]